ncbi:MAG: thioredoxin [Gammaproteobacteria bacterium]|nr:thioredoxin [Gammaproteobacteria bacterium]
MSHSDFTFEATQADFQTLVLENSHKQPVLVDFWAGWCAPCKMLMPILAKLAEEYQGKFILVKVNSDEQQALAMQYGVRSLPTVKVFRNGQVVDEFMGAQPEPRIRAVIERHIVRESDLLHKQAMGCYAQGQLEEALLLLQKASAAAPDNCQIRIDQARIIADKGDIEGTRRILEGLPHDERNTAEVRALLAKCKFAMMGKKIPDMAALEKRLMASADDTEANYQLSIHRILSEDYEDAMKRLLEIVQRDRGYGEDAARKTLLELFEVLGGEHPLVKNYRSRLFRAMY